MSKLQKYPLMVKVTKILLTTKWSQFQFKSEHNSPDSISMIFLLFLIFETYIKSKFK